MDEKDVVSPSLIEGAIKYHGQPLWDALKADQPELWPKLNPELAKYVSNCCIYIDDATLNSLLTRHAL